MTGEPTRSTGSGDAGDQLSLAMDVVNLLARRHETLATAESLTSGLIVSALTRIPGASDVVRGGLAAYATGVKRDVLGVDPGIIANYGVVSAETVTAMARRALALFDCTWAVATSGVAGPDRQDGRAVGTVFVAAVGPAVRSSAYDDVPVAVGQLALSGDRDEIRAATVTASLRLLHDRLDSVAAQESSA